MSLSLSDDGSKAYVSYGNSDDYLKKLDVYDLSSNSVTHSYNCAKNEQIFNLSKDGSRLYIPSIDTGSKTVKLKIINTSDGSTSIKTTHVKGNGKHLAISNIKKYKSDSLLIQGECYLIKADRDGNMNVIQNDSTHAFEDTFNNDDYYTVYKQSGSKKLYAESYDGSSYVDTDNANLSVCAIDDGREVGKVKYPFKDGELRGLSDDGSLFLGYNNKDDKGYLTLVNSKTGAKSETKIDAGLYPLELEVLTGCFHPMQFLHGDREIFVAYTDKKDDSNLRVDIYKSNIPHSVIDDVLYFAQNNLPVVIGGGVVLVLVIGGVVVVCVRRRKKRSGSKDNASGVAPKAKKQKRSRRRKKGQQEDASAASAGVATQQTVNQPAAPAPQPNVAPTASPAPAQQPPAAFPQQPAPQPPTAASTPRFCRHCGSPLTPGSKFCPKCGHPVE